MSMDSFHEKWYLFTDSAGELCNHLSDEETHNADATTYSWLALTIFARKPGKSVEQSERAIYKSAISKQKQTTTLHQG